MSISTIKRALSSRGLTLKKISKMFKLRSAPERITYCTAMLSGLALDHYLWLDETWFDRRTQVRKRARSKRGTKAVVNGIFCRGKRQNVFITPFTQTINKKKSNTPQFQFQYINKYGSHTAVAVRLSQESVSVLVSVFRSRRKELSTPLPCVILRSILGWQQQTRSLESDQWYYYYPVIALVPSHLIFYRL